MTPPSDHAPTWTPAPLSRAEFARLCNRSRSTITEACRPGGPLYAARVADRIDSRHPDAVQYRWRARASGGQSPIVRLDDVSAKEFCARTGAPAAELVEALVPAHHVAACAFAWLADVSVDDVLAAANRGELAAAITPERRLDLLHPAALAYFAAHPFPRNRRGEPAIPAGFLAPACAGDNINIDHPIARVFFTRLDGLPFTDADAERLQKSAS